MYINKGISWGIKLHKINKTLHFQFYTQMLTDLDIDTLCTNKHTNIQCTHINMYTVA